MNNDAMFPRHDGGKNRLKQLLQNLEMDQEQLTNDPRYKEGYDDGYERGKQDAERRAQHIISGLVRLYDES